jgi:hypothetical protein
MFRVLALTLALFLGGVIPHVSAQVLGTGVLPVTEVGANLFQNTITAIESVLQTINMVLELTPVEEVIVGGQLAEDMAAIGEVVSNAQLVWHDAQSLNTQIRVMFDLDTAPDTMPGLQLRLQELQQLAFQANAFAMRAQTLLTTVFNTIDHVTRLIDSVASLVGNMQGNQTLVQTNATISKTLAVMETQQAAWQRADTVDRMSQAVIKASLAKIEQKRWETWPKW